MTTPKVIYRDSQPEKDAWFRYIMNRIRKNENFMCSINGATGSGKTYTALSLAENLSKLTKMEFTIDFVPFSFQELLKLINRKGEEKLGRGSIIVFDEPQTSIGAKDHHTIVNKLFSQLVSTWRHRNYIVFFCNPFIEDIDKTTRKLFHAQFQLLGKDEKHKLASVKPMYIEWSSKKDDFYRHYLKVVFKREGKTKMSSTKLKIWKVDHPSKELVKLYEEKKLAFTSKLNEKMQNELSKLEGEENKEAELVVGNKKPTNIQMLALMMLEKHKKQNVVAKMLNKAGSEIHNAIKGANKKGWTEKNIHIYAQKGGYTLENLVFEQKSSKKIHNVVPTGITRLSNPKKETESIEYIINNNKKGEIEA